MNGISGHSTTTAQRRRWYTSGLAIRMLIALAVAWLVVMAFFATSVISH
jgi:hypothetical protein